MLISEKLIHNKRCNIGAAQLDVQCDFIVKVWNDISTETVIGSSKKCGVSNSIDGAKDDLLWQDEEEAKPKPQHLIQSTIRMMSHL
jgi:hypothetical protein